MILPKEIIDFYGELDPGLLLKMIEVIPDDNEFWKNLDIRMYPMKFTLHVLSRPEQGYRSKNNRRFEVIKTLKKLFYELQVNNERP